MAEKLASFLRRICSTGEVIIVNSESTINSMIAALLAEGLITRVPLKRSGCGSCPLSKVCGGIKCSAYIYRLTEKGRKLCSKMDGGAAGI